MIFSVCVLSSSLCYFIILIVVCRVEEDTLILDNPTEREQEVELEACFSLIVIIIIIS